MTFIYLLIEFLDELVFGVGETAWPLLRDDLALTYTQVGLLLSLPGLVAAFVEPFLGILGDIWKRRALILGGGILFTLSLALTALSHNFLFLLVSFVLFNPASGAFVSLSQATLMDSAPDRHEQNMARWTFAGSLGVVTGPLLLGLFVHFGLGWRGVYAFLAALAGLCLLAAFRFVSQAGRTSDAPLRFQDLLAGFRAALAALRRPDVWRWLLLLEFADLMLDVLLSYLALYFVDVALVSETQAGLAVASWLALGMVTDFLFIPIIDRQANSLDYLRSTALLELLFFTAFLLAPGFVPKLILIVFVNLCNTGWYPILQGRLYSALPGQSASLMAIGSVTAPLARLLPLLIGLLADRFGLGVAAWLLLLGPLALIIGLPRHD
ncbi:MAG: MFS transporter [Chloroflexota bacterium]